MLQKVGVAAAAAATFGVISSAAAAGPSVAQIQAAIATHSDNFVLANAYAHGGNAPGHGWIDLETGAGRWVSANRKLVILDTVTPDPHDPSLVDEAQTTINYTSRTWHRTKDQRPAKTARPTIVDPLFAASAGVKFTLRGVEMADGRQTYHLRSTYYLHTGNGIARLDVWFSTDHKYLIRYRTTTKAGKVVQRIDNHWLRRTPANLALTTMAIPIGFTQVPDSS